MVRLLLMIISFSVIFKEDLVTLETLFFSYSIRKKVSLSFRLRVYSFTNNIDWAPDKWNPSPLWRQRDKVLCAKECLWTLPNAFRFFNEGLAKTAFVPHCYVSINFLFVFVLCFLLDCMTPVQIVPCPSLPQEDFWMEIIDNQPGWLSTLCPSADRSCCVLAG